MSRIATLVYGVVCYLVFLATVLYVVGFVGNRFVPKSIDSGDVVPLTKAVVVNTALLGLFAIQHSLMARPGFKRWWTQWVPAPVERSTYVLTTNLVLGLLFWQWRPIPNVVWAMLDPVGHAVLLGVSLAGWALVVVSTFLIDHFDLFGLRQVWLYATGRPYQSPPFKTPALYRWVRHPIMLGFLIAIWATPVMTWGHLLFAALTTAYIFVGIRLEERDLIAAHGERYAEYRRQVSMIVPLPPR